jgi:hypothetical protein
MPEVLVTQTLESRLSETVRERSEFGTTFSDHMLVADYEGGKWREPRIVLYGPMSLRRLSPLFSMDSLFSKVSRRIEPATAESRYFVFGITTPDSTVLPCVWQCRTCLRRCSWMV